MAMFEDYHMTAYSASPVITLIYSLVECGGARRLSRIVLIPKVSEDRNRSGREREHDSRSEGHD